MSDNAPTQPSWTEAMRSNQQTMSKVDFDNAFDDDRPDLASNAALGAHGAILDGGVGDAAVGTNGMLANYLYRRMLIEELVGEFVHNGDDLVEQLNEELAKRGEPYRLTKGVA